MYQNFTDGAIKAMQFASQLAQRAHCDHIDTEHLLLGLTKVREGVAVKVLGNLGVDVGEIRSQIEKCLDSEQKVSSIDSLPLTSASHTVIECARDEARQLNHEFVDTDHLLLGLLRERDGVAAQVLTNLGLKLEEVREEILHVLDHADESP